MKLLPFHARSAAAAQDERVQDSQRATEKEREMELLAECVCCGGGKQAEAEAKAVELY